MKRWAYVLIGAATGLLMGAVFGFTALAIAAVVVFAVDCGLYVRQERQAQRRSQQGAADAVGRAAGPGAAAMIACTANADWVDFALFAAFLLWALALVGLFCWWIAR